MPLNVPETVDPASFKTMTKRRSPAAGVYPTEPVRFALPKASALPVPDRTRRSWLPAADPAVVPLSLAVKVDPAAKVTFAPAIRMPLPVVGPGATLAPLATVIAPEIVPVPPSVPDPLTATVPVPVALPVAVLARRVPAETVVPPV